MTAGGAHDRAREERIRAILAEHAERTVPAGGLEVIRARAAARRPWWRRLLARQAAPRPYLAPAVRAAVRGVLARHAHDPQGDPVFPDDVRCRICGERPCKNAAPEVESGTAPTTTAVKEPTMSHDLIEEDAPRGRQMAAALALFHLLESGPKEMARWSLDDLGRLHGHVRRPASDAKARAAMTAFAEFLGVGVERSQGRNEHSEWVRLCVTGMYRGTPVNVWTHVAIRAVPPYAEPGEAVEQSAYGLDLARAVRETGGAR